MNLQPLRIEAGWQVTYNQLYEVDPTSGFEQYFEGSSLLMLLNLNRLKFIDVEWRPERDLDGAYHLQVLNCIENYNSKNNSFDSSPIWENPFLEFSSKSRQELVDKLEELMRTLPVFEDPRILRKRGVVDEVSETYRIELVENGISTNLIEQIMENGSAQLQNLVLDHKELTREIVHQFSIDGITKKVRNKANQKLKSKRFSQ